MSGRTAVGDVFFDTKTFEQMDYMKNHASLQYYGDGNVDEYAAVELSDGVILFCLVRGYAFADTFHSADQIHMKYYFLTKLPVKPDSNKKKTK
jgi:hypothetical protein